MRSKLSHARFTAALILGLGLGVAPACSKESPPQREAPRDARDAREQAEAPPTFELVDVTEGLLPRHAGVVPLLEKVACIPAAQRGEEPTCNTQRVYRDEDLYMLTGEATKSWLHLGKLEAGTAAKLEELFAELCGGEDEVMGNDNGTFTYRVSSKRCTREFVVVGFPQGGLEGISAVTDIINGAIVQGSSEAAKQPAEAPAP